MYTKDEMTDKTYKVLVSQVIYTFVENTISLKVEKIFDDIDLTIREASEVLLMDILAQKDSLKRVG